jgi:hypothetical protein
MQHFTLVAHKGGESDRACAIFTAVDIKAAARQSNKLRQAAFLGFIDNGSKFAVRASSRRETDILQRFLASCNLTRTDTYKATDLDGLLSRRQDLMLSFFMALYLDPKSLRDRLDAPLPYSTPSSPSGGGSGGTTQVSQELHPDEAGQKSEENTPIESSGDLDAPEDEPVDNTSQIDILASIASGDDKETRDQHIDLGDDEMI